MSVFDSIEKLTQSQADLSDVQVKIAEEKIQLMKAQRRGIENGDSLITYGWAMEEELRSYTKPD